MANTLTIFHKAITVQTVQPPVVYTRSLLLSLFTDLEHIPLNIPPLFRSSLPGVARANASAISLNNKIYLACGDTPNYLKDFWEYDPTIDTWTQRQISAVQLGVAL